MNLVHVLAENGNKEKFLHISIAFKTEFGTTGQVDQLIFFLFFKLNDLDWLDRQG